MARTYDELIGRAVSDADFRRRLLTDPEGVIHTDGYDVAPEIVAQIKAIDPSAAEAAAQDIESEVGQRMAAN